MKKDNTEPRGFSQQAHPDRFWGHIAHGGHVVQIYDDEEDFMHALFTYADSGFRSDEAVVVIATGEHIAQLDEKLRAAGHNPFSLRVRDQYLSLDAIQTLGEFMINGSPDPILFRYVVGSLLKRAHKSSSRVRAFGEMVAILWANGNQKGTLCLEDLWAEYMEDQPFSLFCAYPRSVFTSGQEEHIEHIKSHHSHQVFEAASEHGISYTRT